MKDAISTLKDGCEDERPYNALPLSSGGLSAGADDPLAGILDFSGANSLDSPGTISQSAPALDGLITLDQDNIRSFNEIQSQMMKIQELLPDIKDVNRRADLVNQLAPQLENQMSMLEEKIKSQSGQRLMMSQVVSNSEINNKQMSQQAELINQQNSKIKELEEQIQQIATQQQNNLSQMKEHLNQGQKSIAYGLNQQESKVEFNSQDMGILQNFSQGFDDQDRLE